MFFILFLCPELECFFLHQVDDFLNFRVEVLPFECVPQHQMSESGWSIRVRRDRHHLRCLYVLDVVDDLELFSVSECLYLLVSEFSLLVGPRECFLSPLSCNGTQLCLALPNVEVDSLFIRVVPCVALNVCESGFGNPRIFIPIFVEHDHKVIVGRRVFVLFKVLTCRCPHHLVGYFDKTYAGSVLFTVSVVYLWLWCAVRPSGFRMRLPVVSDVYLILLALVSVCVAPFQVFYCYWRCTFLRCSFLFDGMVPSWRWPVGVRPLGY